MIFLTFLTLLLAVFLPPFVVYAAIMYYFEKVLIKLKHKIWRIVPFVIVVMQEIYGTLRYNKTITYPYDFPYGYNEEWGVLLFMVAFSGFAGAFLSLMKNHKYSYVRTVQPPALKKYKNLLIFTEAATAAGCVILFDICVLMFKNYPEFYYSNQQIYVNAHYEIWILVIAVSVVLAVLAAVASERAVENGVKRNNSFFLRNLTTVTARAGIVTMAAAVMIFSALPHHFYEMPDFYEFTDGEHKIVVEEFDENVKIWLIDQNNNANPVRKFDNYQGRNKGDYEIMWNDEYVVIDADNILFSDYVGGSHYVFYDDKQLWESIF